MRNYIAPALVAGILLATPVAMAAASAQQSTGTVKSIDMSAMTLTLSNGTTYHLPQGFKDPGLKAGERVQISWNMQNGQYDATTVTIVK
ncbi:MAG: DUF1344 domain-containing protein [Rhizobiales bacterium]|nr:DUF1344 domain-containing protein [Hyphomicrobiales bacterium]